MMAQKRSLFLVGGVFGVVVASCSQGDGVGLLGAPLPGSIPGDGGALDPGGLGGAVNASDDRYVTTGGVAVDATAVAPATLDGFWNVAVTDLSGVTNTMSIDISPIAFTVAHWSGFLQIAGNATLSAFGVSHQAGAQARYLVANHMSIIDMDFGVIPFALSGRWYLSNDPDTGRSCESVLNPTTLKAHCNEVFPPSWIGPMTDGWLDGMKTSELVSVFGQLGGEWQLDFLDGGSCVARFEHTTMGITCTGTGRLDGTSAITFNGDTASGYTARGVEFSAVRQ